MFRNLKHEVLLYDEMVKAGIMPWGSKSFDMTKALALLPPDEARKMKRKFRKLWRKHLKRELKRNTTSKSKHDSSFYTETAIKRRFGAGKKPSQNQAQNRRAVVHMEFGTAASKRDLDNGNVDDDS